MNTSLFGWYKTTVPQLCDAGEQTGGIWARPAILSEDVVSSSVQRPKPARVRIWSTVWRFQMTVLPSSRVTAMRRLSGLHASQ